MASFFEELWNSVFTPGTTPTLLVATNASFAALQLLLIVLLIATYSLHFLVLSVLCGGLWWSINWFVSELRAAKAQEELYQQREKNKSQENEKSQAGDSDTETESPAAPKRAPGPKDSPTLLKPKPTHSEDTLTRRRSHGDSSGYVSTDSEWEKVSEGDMKDS